MNGYKWPDASANQDNKMNGHRGLEVSPDRDDIMVDINGWTSLLNQDDKMSGHSQS